MATLVRTSSEPSARTGSVDQMSAPLDPLVYLTAARSAQARALAEALGSVWRGLTMLRERIKERRARRSERRRAIAQLMQLDDRLLNDIGLRRSDIELAVDGLLADPRVTRRQPAAAASPAEQPGRPAPAVVPAARVDADQSPVPAPPEPPTELAA